MPTPKTAIEKPPRQRPKITCGPSRVVKDPTDISDINEIIRRSKISGTLVNPQQVNPNRQAVFGDFSSGADFEDTNLKIAAVNNEFQQLTADQREAFNNDPANLLDALSNPDPEIIKALEDIGLQSIHELPVEPEPAPAVDPVDPPAVE